MKSEMLLDKFGCEKQCEYKGRTYLVRDNGSICRVPKANGKPSKWDSIWTFGKKDNSDGYMKIAGVRIHQIVATAFHGEPPSSQYVVDHIDTNRRNNRPENLTILKKTENILCSTALKKKTT